MDGSIFGNGNSTVLLHVICSTGAVRIFMFLRPPRLLFKGLGYNLGLKKLNLLLYVVPPVQPVLLRGGGRKISLLQRLIIRT